MTSLTTSIISISIFFGSIIVAIIGYFLRKTMDKQEEIDKATILIRKDLDVLKKDHDNKHEYLTEKFDDLKDSIVLLTNEIKQLTAKIK